MSVPHAILIAVIAWLVVVGGGQLVVLPLLNRSFRAVNPLSSVLWHIARFYSRFWQRCQWSGLEHVPTPEDAKGIIVVANHTGALDPIMIQSRCRFHVRWMMAADMLNGALHWLSTVQPLIPVDRDGTDSGPLREAIRHARRGGIVGIFPEGRITIPPRELRPFLSGVGVVVTRAKAPVLLVWVSGTPDTNKMGAALRARGHARVQFLGLIDYGDERDPAKVSEDLRLRIAEVSGWPLNDDVLPPGGGV